MENTQWKIMETYLKLAGKEAGKITGTNIRWWNIVEANILDSCIRIAI